MQYVEQLKVFLGAGVDDEELRATARAAVAADVRELKVAIAGRVWKARQRSAAGDQPAAAALLAHARQLQGEYEAALAEFATLAAGGPPAQAA